jgi:hypothetical protein
MTGDDHPRIPRRPGLLAWLVRCRVELAAITSGSLLAHVVDPAVIGLLMATAGILVASVPAARHRATRAYQLVLLPHRVRSALAEAGAVDRRGRLPWVLWALPAGPNAARVEVKLRAGVTFEDLHGAVSNLGVACAAQEVKVFLHKRRPDRARIFLIRPHWGLW